MKDVLADLCGRRRADLEKRERALGLEGLLSLAAGAPPVRDFAARLARPGVNVIAELKRASPSAGMIRPAFDPAALARELESAGAAALSVLCEPHAFLGSEAYLAAARAATSLPVLYKDFVTTRAHVAAARACGADAVLLIAAALDDGKLAALLSFAHSLGMSALVETHDEIEIDRAVAAGARIVGVNCRNLRDFSIDTRVFGRLAGRIPADCVKVAESGIRDAETMTRLSRAGVQAFLIGTRLMSCASPGEALGTLVSGTNEERGTK